MRRHVISWMVALAMLCLASLVAPSAQAQHGGWQTVQWQIDAQGHVAVTATVDLALSQPVLNALHRGVPVYFMASAQLERQRRWWWPKHEASAERYWRLSHLPLTGAWQLQHSSSPFAPDAPIAGLAQRFSSLDAALAALEHIGPWQIAPVAPLRSGRYFASLQFEIDRSLLPRPLQFDTDSRAGWELILTDRQHLLLDDGGLRPLPR